MSQKSSDPQAISFVSQPLKRDTVAGEEARALTLTPGEYAETVVLNLMNPIGPGRRLLSRTG